MARGVVSGVIWGTVVAGVGMGGLSLAYPDFKPVAQAEEMLDPVASASDTPSLEDDAQTANEETVATEPVEETAPERSDDTATALDDVTDTLTEDEPAPETALVNEPEVTEAPVDEAMTETSAPDLVDAETPTEDVTSVQADPETASEDTVVETTQSTEVTEPDVDPVETPESDTADTNETSENAEVSERITDEIIAALPKSEGTVGDLAPTVTTDRLPSVSDDTDSAEEGPSAVAPPPFERFAANVTVEDEKPRMAIVLIDDGAGELGVEALEAFPYPITFAVDASSPEAAERMQLYRDKGFEVLALVDLPRGATPSDVEVSMAAFLAAVPEAVGILEGVETGVQTSREMADQLTQIILESGHGMLLQKSGLNTARKLAEREGIPAGTVFRDFDGNGQSASVMRRFLDQAAFRAGQEGGVVMMGRLQAETISALLIWGLADRASRVALVPVSKVLKQTDSDS